MCRFVVWKMMCEMGGVDELIGGECMLEVVWEGRRIGNILPYGILEGDSDVFM